MFSDLFAQVDKKFKLYAKKSALAHPSLKFAPSDLELNSVSKPQKDEGGKKSHIEKEADRIILDQYGPAGVLIKANLEILQFRGHTGLYLEPAPGAVSFDLLKMARPALVPDLRAAIHEAQRRKLPVRREGLRVKYNGQFRKVNIQVVPIPSPASEEGYLLILFEDALSNTNTAQPEPEPSRGKRQTKKRAGDAHIIKVEEELVAAREYLRSEVARHQSTIDELNSANEEIQSANEELQSINEELETAKEELQATNEELAHGQRRATAPQQRAKCDQQRPVEPARQHQHPDPHARTATCASGASPPGREER